MTEPPFSPPATQPEHHHRLVQAPVAAVDVDGIRVVAGGTAIFAVAAVVTGVLRDQLAADGRDWWFAACLSGFGLGLVGLLYCWNRVRQRRAGTEPTLPATDSRVPPAA